MKDLAVPDSRFVAFRGEPGLEQAQARVDAQYAVDAAEVAVLRARPNSGYVAAGAKAMQGDWKPTAGVFRRLLDNFLAEP